jgi:hypothetical protein
MIPKPNNRAILGNDGRNSRLVTRREGQTPLQNAGDPLQFDSGGQAPVIVRSEAPPAVETILARNPKGGRK